MPELATWMRRFAVRGVFWRQYLDWAVGNVPVYFVPLLIWFWTTFFFFFAAPARRAVVSNLSIIHPKSGWFAKHLCAWRTLYNFAWTITEAADYKLKRSRFCYEIEGADNLEALAAAKGAIVLTAHIGSYDLGAAIFAEKFRREIRIVRAPEPDRLTARHLDETLEKSGSGAVRVDYTTEPSLLSFDLLRALRENEIVSIQGDRVVGDVAHSAAQLFGKTIRLPTGPFILSQIAEAPIFPLFIVRRGYRRYKIIARSPFICERRRTTREEEISVALRHWCSVLENVIQEHWDQWFAFVPTFGQDERDAA